MKKFLENLFWQTISNTLSLSVPKSKVHINDVIKRIETNTATRQDFSPQITSALDFYYENINYIK